MSVSLSDQTDRAITITGEVKQLLLGLHPKEAPTWDPRIKEHGLTTLRYNSVTFQVRKTDYNNMTNFLVTLMWDGRAIAHIHYAAHDLMVLDLQGLEGRVNFKLE